MLRDLQIRLLLKKMERYRTKDGGVGGYYGADDPSRPPPHFSPIRHAPVASVADDPRLRLQPHVTPMPSVYTPPPLPKTEERVPQLPVYSQTRPSKSEERIPQLPVYSQPPLPKAEDRLPQLPVSAPPTVCPIRSVRTPWADDPVTRSPSVSPIRTEGHMINPVNDEEARRFQMLMKAFQPPPEDEGLSTPERKKKMFSSSSFYDEPTHRYPTMEEQVKLCKQIADSLSAEPNVASRGATMYIKRKKRSFNWITEGPDPTSSESETYGDYDSDAAQRPQSYTDGDRPKLKLVLDPRQLQDAMKLAKTGMHNEHNVVSPDVCFSLVRDLNSPTGKGAQLFAKRKKKSESWVVDENSVKEALSKQPQLPDVAPLPTSDYRFQTQTLQQHLTQAITQQQAPVYVPPPINKLQEIQDRLHPKVKLVKSPWEAALESPYGSCDAAFELVQKASKPAAPLMPLAENLLYATERMEPLPPLQPVNLNTTYVPPPLPTTDMRVFSPRPYSPQQNIGPLATAPPPKAPQRAPQQQAPQPPPRTASPFGRNLYSAKVPKGWTGSTPDQFQQPQQWQQEPALQFSDFDQYTTIPEPRGESPSFNKYSLDQFGNYNNTAKAWTGGYSRPPAQGGFRPVRPVSMYVK